MIILFARALFIPFASLLRTWRYFRVDFPHILSLFGPHFWPRGAEMRNDDVYRCDFCYDYTLGGRLKVAEDFFLIHWWNF